MDVIHHRIYSSKFAVNVLDLSHIELATEEDKLPIRYVISMPILMCEKGAEIERIMN